MLTNFLGLYQILKKLLKIFKLKKILLKEIWKNQDLVEWLYLNNLVKWERTLLSSVKL